VGNSLTEEVAERADLKYMAEMNRLYGDPEYGGGEPDLTELDDAEHVREMVRSVGAAAYEQVADFLELCGKEIERHFTGLGIATIAKKRKRTFIVRDWYWEARIHVPSVPGGRLWCGVWVTAPPEVRIPLENEVCGLVIPYLWTKGGRRGADTVWKILGGWTHSRGGEGLAHERGTVALACIPIKAQPPEGFDVDRAPLIKEVSQTIARIGPEQTRAIARFAAKLKEPDES
jgi:hypothetical protein